MSNASGAISMFRQGVDRFHNLNHPIACKKLTVVKKYDRIKQCDHRHLT